MIVNVLSIMEKILEHHAYIHKIMPRMMLTKYSPVEHTIVNTNTYMHIQNGREAVSIRRENERSTCVQTAPGGPGIEERRGHKKTASGIIIINHSRHTPK